MSGLCLITIEGVLGRPDFRHPDSFVALIPNVIGVSLYHSLKHMFKIVLVTDEKDESKVYHWLGMQGLKDHATILTRRDEDVALDTPEHRKAQLARVRSEGVTVALVVDASPKVTERLLESGVHTLLFVQPQHSKPEFRASPGMQEWDKIVEEVERRKAQTQEQAKNAEQYQEGLGGRFE